jgi:hypothetical protein
MLETYHIVPEDEQKLYKQKTGSIKDPAKKRELKIDQYKKEKALTVRIEVSVQQIGRSVNHHFLTESSKTYWQ